MAIHTRHLGFVYLQVMDRHAVARDDNINGLSKCHSTHILLLKQLDYSLIGRGKVVV